MKILQPYRYEFSILEENLNEKGMGICMEVRNKGIDFPLEGEVTRQDVLWLQERLLDMAVTVKDILEKNQIRYSIIAGTLIGAVRHQGFIPWDLDFDMCIVEDEYDDAMKCIEEFIPDWMVVQSPESDPFYSASWCKIVDRCSELHYTRSLTDNRYTYRGIHMDIYKLGRTNEDSIEHDILTENLRYFNMKYKRGLMERKEYEETVEKLEKDLSTTKATDGEKTLLYHMRWLKVEERYIFPTIPYLFEGITFAGPEDYDTVLRHCTTGGISTADYMTIPQWERRVLGVDQISMCIDMTCK